MFLQSTLNSVGTKLISKQERDMIKFPSFAYGVIIGLLLSDAWLQLQSKQRSINSHLGLKQSLDKSKYVWFVFSILAPYCSSCPFLVSGVRAGVRHYGLQFFTRALPCLTEIYSLFYIDSIKVIPQNIFELLTPVALAHELRAMGSLDLMVYNFALTLILYLM
jgi:hypothetical protein